MGVECTGRGVEITPRLRALAEERASRLERHLGGPVTARVVLSHEKHRYGAEVIATHRRRKWTAQEETGDPRTALTLAFEKIDAQAMKDAEKRHDRRHRGAAVAIPLRVSEGNEPAPPESRGRSPRGGEPRLVRAARKVAAKPMSVEEAAMRIEGSREDCLVFRDSGSEKISVLYRRRDGDFGLIVPEC
ncbi:MAG: ribosome hibernation-promoting factor, HPF/YfiA family [Thermoanaerobaculia bacterium]